MVRSHANSWLSSRRRSPGYHGEMEAAFRSAAAFCVCIALDLLPATDGRAAEPRPADGPAASQLAPAGGWKLSDLTQDMRLLGGRSLTSGKQVFERAHSALCHPQADGGQAFGPNLTKLDPQFQPLDILRDILDPSRRIADRRFDTWIFESDSGTIVAGLVLQETDQLVKVAENPLAVASPAVLDKSRIASRTMSLVSAMPQGMLDTLTRDEIADLVAFIAARGDVTDPVVRSAADEQRVAGQPSCCDGQRMAVSPVVPQHGPGDRGSALVVGSSELALIDRPLVGPAAEQSVRRKVDAVADRAHRPVAQRHVEGPGVRAAERIGRGIARRVLQRRRG